MTKGEKLAVFMGCQVLVALCRMNTGDMLRNGDKLRAAEEALTRLGRSAGLDLSDARTHFLDLILQAVAMAEAES